MNIEKIYTFFLKHRIITTDSRKSKVGSLFFALKGENFDGNKFAEIAIENGCNYAIIDNIDYKKNDQYIVVENVLDTLQELANFHRKVLDIPIIAITGTNGKTTTKELISEVLRQKYNVVNTIGNLNNHIGVPLTLLSMDENTQLGIVEMGANHMNEIRELCEIAEPDYGIITNIGKAHLEGFGSFENIIATKGELYDYLNEYNKTIFFNEKNDILKSLTENLSIKTISYSGDRSNVRGEALKTELFLNANVNIGYETIVVNTNLIGNYNLENVLAAACIGNYFKIDNNNIKKAIENYTPKNNRSQFLETKSNKLYLDAYNANPTSVDAALQNFFSLNVLNKVVILGDMLELGDTAVKEHSKVLELVAKQDFTKVILVGAVYSTLSVDRGILQFKNVDETINWLKNNNIAESNVLIKGSRGIRLEKLVEYL